MKVKACRCSFLGKLGSYILISSWTTSIDLAVFWKTFIVALSNENLLKTAKTSLDIPSSLLNKKP
jgi:hypothetical protein